MTGIGSDAPGWPRRPGDRPASVPLTVRAAREPVERLLRQPAYDPEMKRPVSTVAGGMLVLIGAVVGVLMIIDLSLHWRTYAGSLQLDLDDLVATPDIINASLAIVLVVLGAIVLVELTCVFFILRGSNVARVIVLSVAVMSISTTFVSWWAQGQEVTLTTTLPSVAIDILVLLALSSRSTAAYARRNEKR